MDNPSKNNQNYDGSYDPNQDGYDYPSQDDPRDARDPRAGRYDSQRGGYPDDSQRGGYPDESQQGGYPDESQQGGYPDDYRVPSSDRYDPEYDPEYEEPYYKDESQGAEQNYTDGYRKGPSKPNRQVNDEINQIVQETLVWLKSFFSADYTDSVLLAKKSHGQYAWALLFLVYFILFPLSQLFGSLRLDLGAGANVATWAFGILQSVLDFGVMTGVLLLAQVVFNEFSDWWRPVNAAAVCLLPRILLMPFSILFGALNIVFFNELLAILATIVTVMTILLMRRFMTENPGSKSRTWIVTVLIVLYLVLRSGIMRIR